MTSETAVQQHIRLDASNMGVDLWRNNSGALPDETGRMIRYGLANDSSVLNKEIKSSDLIGIKPTLIMPHHVGHILGIFTAVETKRSDWTLKPDDERAAAQQRFIDIVLKNGGLAGFARSVDEFRAIVRRF